MTTDAFVPIRRQIFGALDGKTEPMTTAEIAKAIEGHLPTVANTCSLMETMGALDRPHGARHGYRLIVDMLPEDRTVLTELIAVYGFDRICEHVETLEHERDRAERATPEWAQRQLARKADELRRRLEDGRFSIAIAEKELQRVEGELAGRVTTGGEP